MSVLHVHSSATGQGDADMQSAMFVPDARVTTSDHQMVGSAGQFEISCTDVLSQFWIHCMRLISWLSATRLDKPVSLFISQKMGSTGSQLPFPETHTKHLHCFSFQVLCQ